MKYSKPRVLMEHNWGVKLFHKREKKIFGDLVGTSGCEDLGGGKLGSEKEKSYAGGGTRLDPGAGVVGESLLSLRSRLGGRK